MMELITAEEFANRQGFARYKVAEKYSWAPVTTGVVEAVIAFITDGREQTRSFVELFAGNALLTKALRDKGLYVSAVDNRSTHRYSSEVRFTRVKNISVERFKRLHDYDVVCVTWPPYLSKSFEKLLTRMKSGQYLLYIGEHAGGCTSSEKSDKMMLEDFERINDPAIDKADDEVYSSLRRKGYYDTISLLRKK